MALLAGSAGVDSSSGSAGGTPFPKAKVWQVTQKQKTVDDLVSVIRNYIKNVFTILLACCSTKSFLLCFLGYL